MTKDKKVAGLEKSVNRKLAKIQSGRLGVPQKDIVMQRLTKEEELRSKLGSVNEVELMFQESLNEAVSTIRQSKPEDKGKLLDMLKSYSEDWLYCIKEDMGLVISDEKADKMIQDAIDRIEGGDYDDNFVVDSDG